MVIINALRVAGFGSSPTFSRIGSGSKRSIVNGAHSYILDCNPHCRVSCMRKFEGACCVIRCEGPGSVLNVVYVEDKESCFARIMVDLPVILSRFLTYCLLVGVSLVERCW